jgi:hypothetical protein
MSEIVHETIKGAYLPLSCVLPTFCTLKTGTRGAQEEKKNLPWQKIPRVVTACPSIDTSQMS